MKVDAETGEVDLAGPVPTQAQIPQRTIDELVSARRIAKDYAQGFSDAVKAQAEKYKIKPGALKRYVAALCDDKVEDCKAETDDLDALLDHPELLA